MICSDKKITGRPFLVKEAVKNGKSRMFFSRACKCGALERIARGIYVDVNQPMDELTQYAWACAAVPRGVIGLRTALVIHEISDDLPHRIMMCIPAHSRAPKTSLPVDFSYSTDKWWALGVETIDSSAGAIRVYSVEKTIVDLFRLRNKYGVTLAVEALRTASAAGKLNIAVLDSLIRTGRMRNVMMPYVEAVL